MSVDLQEVDGAAEVCELVVEVPTHVDQAHVREALEVGSSASVLSTRACARDEPMAEAQRWALSVESWADPGLHARVGAACPLASVWLQRIDEARSYQAVELALERRAPVVHRTTDTPEITGTEGRPSPRWLLAVADRHPDARVVALVARPTALPFSATEVARVQLLMAS